MYTGAAVQICPGARQAWNQCAGASGTTTTFLKWCDCALELSPFHPSSRPHLHPSMSKRIRIYTASDVLRHNSESSCWVTYRGKVLDVTNFLADHPGGEEFILKHAGRDVEDAMGDKGEHVHSESAFDMLDEFLVGRLGAGEDVVSDDWVATDDFTPDDTDEAADYEKNQFLDLRKPLMRQMWDCNFRHVFLRSEFNPMCVLTAASRSKSYYLQQVHQPRHLPESARLFGPAVLEVGMHLMLRGCCIESLVRCSRGRSGGWCPRFGCP